MRDRKKTPPESGLDRELLNLEKDLAFFLAGRSKLLAKAASARRAKKNSPVDPAQEKALWRVWEKQAAKSGLDIRLCRRIFALANGLAYARARGEKKRGLFTLYPGPRPVDLDIEGPRCLLTVRLWTAALAASGRETSLSPVILNDSLLELAKALNQAGAGLSWEKDALLSEQGKGLNFAGKTVFAGGDLFNFYLLLAFSLAVPGRATFAGDARLRACDLSFEARALAGLGVRLAGIEPYSTGLPVRVENAGLAREFKVPDDFPPDLVCALALAGPLYPDGLKFTWSPSWTGSGSLEQAASVLRACGIDVAAGENEFSVSPGTFNIPDRPDLPLDPLLGAYLLAMPKFRKGRVRLKGSRPGETLEADTALSLLRAAGLLLEVREDGITSSPGPEPEALVLDCAGIHGYVPLALALAAALPGESKVLIPPGSEDTDQAGEFLDLCGRRFEVKPGQVTVAKGSGIKRRARRGAWTGHDPFWHPALALVSLCAPGISIADSGDFSLLWPGFWSLFQSWFHEPETARKIEEPPCDDRPDERTGEQPGRKRRVHVRKDKGD
ncbi:MAG: hypothetical protein SVS15_05475 [Thermodesulfobacteriota bacterium]|nr:hypothetical protein [Thermodesulfobacteriota bacterium]